MTSLTPPQRGSLDHGGFSSVLIATRLGHRQVVHISPPLFSLQALDVLDILTTKTQSGSTILNQNFLCREMTLVQHRTSQPTPLTARHTLPKVHFNPAYIALHRVHFKKNALLLSLLGSALLGLGFLGKEEESYMCHWALHSFNNNPITNPSLQKKSLLLLKP